MAKETLTAREAAFCEQYAAACGAREAAARAGYRMRPERAGAKLLSQPRACREIARIRRERQSGAPTAADGLRRLAFGSVADAGRLLYRDNVEGDGAFESMDLFQVSEIRRPRDGCMEIKFFDRIKALQALSECEAGGGENETASSFFRALSGAEGAAEEA